MRFSKWIAVIVMALVAAACSKEKETPKGYKYTVVRRGDGNIPKLGNYIHLDFVFKDSKDSVWNDSRKQEFPVYIPVRDTVGMKMEEGLDELLRLVSKGDSVVMKLVAKDLFEKNFRQPVPPNVDPKSEFTFIINVKDVLDSARYSKAVEEIRTKQMAMQQKQMEEFKAQQEQQLGKDTLTIDNYLKDKNIKAKTTASGLRYVIEKPGKGPNAKAGQTAKLNYTGYLLDGKHFDTSLAKVAKDNNIFIEGRPYEPISVTIGTGSVIQGWEDALVLMNKGSKIKLFVPSPLGYGPRRSGEVIAENSILVFEMEMLDIK